MESSRSSSPGSSRDDPSSAGSPLDRVEELVAECVERWTEEGEAALDDLCARHPEDSDELRRQFEVLREAGVLDQEDEVSRFDFPERLGKYRLLRRLGGGGMGVVFEAREEPLGRPVAVKLIRPEQRFFEGSRRRFLREMESISRLQHPGIVPVYALEESEGVPFYVMERIQGCTLAEVLEDLCGRGPVRGFSGIEFAEAVARCTPGHVNVIDQRSAVRHFGRSWTEACLRIVLQVAEALDHAHRRGVLHRDVKPSNIMVSPDGRALLLDFGLARTEDADELTKTGAHIGSLPYMSPEQLGGRPQDVDGRIDVYALGVSLYEVLTLRSPFLCEDAESTRRAILEGNPRPIRLEVPSLSWEEETVCLTAMSSELSQRYAGAGAFARDLHNALEGRSIVARRPSTLRRARRWIARHPTLSVFLVLCGVVFLFSVGIAIERDRSLRNIRTIRGQRDDATAERDQRTIDRDRLYYSWGLDSLTKRARDLWPARPEVVTRPGGMDDWISEAEVTLSGLLSQRSLLVEVRGRGRRVSEEEHVADDASLVRMFEHRRYLQERLAVAEQRAGGAGAAEDLTAELSRVEDELIERWSWIFDDPLDEWWNSYLIDLKPQIERLLALKEFVERRRELAMTVERRSLFEAAEAWEAVRVEVAAEPRYQGLDLAPQWGLVPLGRDPGSGLFEFVHLGTADLDGEQLSPVRESETDRIVVDEKAGLVFVLIPPLVAPDGEALDAFFLSKFEMSEAQCSRAFGTNPSHHGGAGAALNPVENISWAEARRGLLDQEMDLPTVAQWRAVWNADPERSVAPAPLFSARQGPREIGGHAPDALGLLGLADNVAEWCRDAADGPPMVESASGARDGERWTWRKDRHLAAGGSFREPEGPGLLWPQNPRDDVGLRPMRAVEFSPRGAGQERESQEPINGHGEVPPAADLREGEKE